MGSLPLSEQRGGVDGEGQGEAVREGPGKDEGREIVVGI